jgi:hypothetical protein
MTWSFIHKGTYVTWNLFRVQPRQKKKKLFDKKKSFELHCDLIFYLQRYVGN